MNISEHLTHAEVLQLREELAATSYRRKAWTVLACALAAFWIVIGAVVWMVWL